MDVKLCGMVLLCLSLLATTPATAGTIPPGTLPQPALKVLPLGDSITLGAWTNGGYRLPLSQLVNVEFIGPLAANSEGMAYPQHAGFSGYRIDQIQAQIATISGTPDVILLHVGTNDLYQAYQLESTNARLSSLVAALRAKWRGVRIIVATVGPYAGGNYTQIDAMNAAAVAYNDYITNLAGVEVAHMALTPEQLQDGIHPNAQGYGVMAKVWRDAMMKPRTWEVWLPWVGK